MTNEEAIAEFAKGIFTYVQDGNVIELHECGFIQELLDAMKAGGLSATDEDDESCT